MMYKINLIDGNNNFFRMMFKLSNLINGGSFGFSKMLLMDEIKSANLNIVCWDAGKSKRRLELLPEYKQNRPKRDEDEVQDIYRQIDICREFVEVLGNIDLFIKGVEADDLIAILTKYYQNKMINKNKTEINIVSTDTDFIQLLKYKNVQLYNPVKKEYFDCKEFGLDPKDYVYYKSLIGDSSDNISGLKGVGDKRAKQIVEEYNLNNGIIKNQKLLKYFNEDSNNIIERNKKMIGFEYIDKDIEENVLKIYKEKKINKKKFIELDFHNLCMKYNFNSFLTEV